MRYRVCLALTALLLCGTLPGCGPKGGTGGARGGNGGGSSTTSGGPESTVAGLSLAEARKKHPTAILRRGMAPQTYSRAVPAGAERVAYGGKKLLAWLARPSGDGRHPAVLWAHAGLALTENDFNEARPFLDAGFVVLAPAWRG